MNDIQALAGNTDIYLLDQILKKRYRPGEILLDAGCGGGRNLHWFLLNKMNVYATDIHPQSIPGLPHKDPRFPYERFTTCPVEEMPFHDLFFDHIISSAVLHFAKTTEHFFSMLTEMLRVLKAAGTLFIRMTSDIGIENRVKPVGEGVYSIPDGSRRFLLTRSILKDIFERYPVQFLEEFKTVNVNDVRCMSTLVLVKT
jgi:ubiquinone/menaquinone biosynthesis C-methylase UbiE